MSSWESSHELPGSLSKGEGGRRAARHQRSTPPCSQQLRGREFSCLVKALALTSVPRLGNQLCGGWRPELAAGFKRHLAEAVSDALAEAGVLGALFCGRLAWRRNGATSDAVRCSWMAQESLVGAYLSQRRAGQEVQA